MNSNTSGLITRTRTSTYILLCDKTRVPMFYFDSKTAIKTDCTSLMCCIFHTFSRSPGNIILYYLFYSGIWNLCRLFKRVAAGDWGRCGVSTTRTALWRHETGLYSSIILYASTLLLLLVELSFMYHFRLRSLLTFIIYNKQSKVQDPIKNAVKYSNVHVISHLFSS